MELGVWDRWGGRGGSRVEGECVRGRGKGQGAGFERGVGRWGSRGRGMMGDGGREGRG